MTETLNSDDQSIHSPTLNHVTSYPNITVMCLMYIEKLLDVCFMCLRYAVKLWSSNSPSLTMSTLPQTFFVIFGVSGMKRSQFSPCLILLHPYSWNSFSSHEKLIFDA